MRILDIYSSQSLLSLALTSLLFSPVISAATFTWSNPAANGSSGDTTVNPWTTGSNWTGNSAPTSSSSTIVSFGDSGGNMTTNAPSELTLNRIDSNNSGVLRINSGSKDLTFSGANAGVNVINGAVRLELGLTGSTTFYKTGSGDLQMNLQFGYARDLHTNYEWTGNIVISEGSVTALNNNALGASGKTVTVADGASLNWNGQELGSYNILNPVALSGTNAKSINFSIAGDGSGTGALVNSGASLSAPLDSGINNLTLTADASIGGSGDMGIGWVSGNTYVYGNGNTLTKKGSSTVSIQSRASNVSWDVEGGTLLLYKDNGQTGLGNNSVVVRNGATLDLREDYGTGVGDGSASLTLEGGATFKNALSNNYQEFSTAVNLSGGVGDSGLTTLSVGSNTSQITLSGGATGSGGIRKQGNGSLAIYDAASYTGDTIIEGGRLYAGVQLDSSPNIVLKSATSVFENDIYSGEPVEYIFTVGQTVSGIGTVFDGQGGVGVAGTVSPGNSPGVLTFDGGVTFYNGSQIVWELWDNTTDGRGTTFDGINVTNGDLVFDGPTTLNLDFSGGSVAWTNPFWVSFFQGGADWLLFDVAGTDLLLGLENLSVNTENWVDSNGLYFNDYHSGGFMLKAVGNDVYLTAVPEPSALFTAGLLGCGLFLRRRKR